MDDEDDDDYEDGIFATASDLLKECHAFNLVFEMVSNFASNYNGYN